MNINATNIHATPTTPQPLMQSGMASGYAKYLIVSESLLTLLLIGIGILKNSPKIVEANQLVRKATGLIVYPQKEIGDLSPLFLQCLIPAPSYTVSSQMTAVNQSCIQERTQLAWNLLQEKIYEKVVPQPLLLEKPVDKTATRNEAEPSYFAILYENMQKLFIGLGSAISLSEHRPKNHSRKHKQVSYDLVPFQNNRLSIYSGIPRI